ncbi:MAG: rhomboid family intramembrane serine protease [Armatimonadetes bacterium]|nr:rhomboid family intramembrane serine protease [Armatimonadota bacterium]
MFFFLPLGTTRPRWRSPYLTYGIMCLCACVHLVQIYAPEALPAGFIPGHPSISGWLASAFMHGDPLHLAGNMLFLWLFATLTEDVFGHWLLLGVYFAGHFGATLLHSLFAALAAPREMDTPLIGASGAIAGIMGLTAVCFLQTKVRVWYLALWYVYFRTNIVEIGAPLFVGFWVGWELVQGLVLSAFGIPTQTAHWAHVGGFAAGLGLALGLRLRSKVVHNDLVDGKRPPENAFEAFAQMAELEKMSRKTPEDPEIWLALGRARELGKRGERAAEAYQQALDLALRQRREEEVVRAYDGLRDTGSVTAVGGAMQFALACTLAERGRELEALPFFQEVADSPTGGPDIETALIRAGDIAGRLPGKEAEARHYLRRLLDEYPNSAWRHLALRGLQHLPKPTSETVVPTARPAQATENDEPEDQTGLRFRLLGEELRPPDED